MWHWSVLYCTHKYHNDKSKISKFARFKFKLFQGFSSTFKHLICFQALSRALNFFIANSSIFKDFSSTLWTLYKEHCAEALVITDLVCESRVSTSTRSGSQLELYSVTFTGTTHNLQHTTSASSSSWLCPGRERGCLHELPPRSSARWQAVKRSIFACWRSDSTVHSHVVLGLPSGRLQSFGG